MRLMVFIGMLVFGLQAEAQSPADLWNQLKAKRESLLSFHEEFEVSRTLTSSQGSQSRKWQISIDTAMGRWRETTIGGFSAPIRIFDGKDTLSFEEGASEYTRVKNSKNQAPLPAPYNFEALEWSRAAERERSPCGLQPQDHTCVVLDIPVKKWMRPETNSHFTHLLDGTVRAKVDIETGLLIAVRTVQTVESSNCVCVSDIQYVLKRQSFKTNLDAGLFELPAGNTREVKQLPRWTASRIKDQLGGKAAPEIVANDLQGMPVSLSAFKGKIVLLDFWATWCPPCRTDAPSLEKLYQKYGNKNLSIVGFSVEEDRKVVEKFLKSHPAGYPIVVTSENEVPRPYQVGVIPTYVIIDENGLVQAAIQGDQGFSELRKLLQKVGLETD